MMVVVGTGSGGGEEVGGVVAEVDVDAVVVAGLEAEVEPVVVVVVWRVRRIHGVCSVSRASSLSPTAALLPCICRVYSTTPSSERRCTRVRYSIALFRGLTLKSEKIQMDSKISPSVRQ